MGRELINEPASATLPLHTHDSNSNERELLAEAKGGSLAAYRQLVDRYAARIFRLAQTIAPSRQDAEEIMQDAFVRAFRNLSGFRGDSRFYAWLARIAIDEGLMKLRRRRPNAISVDYPVASEARAPSRELEDWGPTPERRYSQQELRDVLAAAIGQLPPGYRTVFQLRDIEGFSTEQTARALGLSPTAVKTRLCRARLRLRDSLNERFRAAAATGPRCPNSHSGSERRRQLPPTAAEPRPEPSVPDQPGQCEDHPVQRFCDA